MRGRKRPVELNGISIFRNKVGKFFIGPSIPIINLMLAFLERMTSRKEAPFALKFDRDYADLSSNLLIYLNRNYCKRLDMMRLRIGNLLGLVAWLISTHTITVTPVFAQTIPSPGGSTGGTSISIGGSVSLPTDPQAPPPENSWVSGGGGDTLPTKDLPDNHIMNDNGWGPVQEGSDAGGTKAWESLDVEEPTDSPPNSFGPEDTTLITLKRALVAAAYVKAIVDISIYFYTDGLCTEQIKTNAKTILGNIATAIGSGDYGKVCVWFVDEIKAKNGPDANCGTTCPWDLCKIIGPKISPYILALINKMSNSIGSPGSGDNMTGGASCVVSFRADQNPQMQEYFDAVDAAWQRLCKSWDTCVLDETGFLCGHKPTAEEYEKNIWHTTTGSPADLAAFCRANRLMPGEGVWEVLEMASQPPRNIAKQCPCCLGDGINYKDSVYRSSQFGSVDEFCRIKELFPGTIFTACTNMPAMSPSTGNQCYPYQSTSNSCPCSGK